MIIIFFLRKNLLAQMVRKMLHDVTTIFSWEAQETDERQLAKIAAMELKDVDLFLNSLE